MTIGKRIKERRKEAGLTLKQMSDLVGISVSFLSDIENGRSNPSLDRLETIAEKLGTSVSWIMGEDGVIKEASEAYQVAEFSVILRRLISFPKFVEVIDCLKEFPEWNESDKEELISYLRAKRLSRKNKLK